MEDKCLTKIPYDHKAEITVVGALFLGPSSLFDHVFAIIIPDDFYVTEHRTLVTIMARNDFNDHPSKQRQIRESLNINDPSLLKYIDSISYTSIQEDELARLCIRIRECAMGRIVVKTICENARKLTDGDIDAVRFLQLSHASIFASIERFHMPALAGLRSCEIMDELYDLANKKGWYTSMIKCLQARWKEEATDDCT